MAIHFTVLALSVGILYFGAEFLVKGSASLALRAGLTPLMIGLTIVSFSTSSPELVVCVKAASIGQGDIALGNVVGSNLFNIGVILGLTALLCPVPVKSQILRVDAPIMVAVSFAVPVLLLDGQIDRLEGVLLFSGIVGYTLMNVVLARRNVSAELVAEYEEGIPHLSGSLRKDLLLIVGGLGALVVGARLLVESASEIARDFGVSEALIGLTIVAAGTSVPELATSAVAAIKKEPDIAVGNVVGSNIFNILCILGAAGVVAPISAPGIGMLDIAAMLGISLLLLPLLWSGRRLQRFEGAVLLAAYAAYFAAIWPQHS